MFTSFQGQKDPVAKLDFPFDNPHLLKSLSWPYFDSIAQWTRIFLFLSIFSRPFMFFCINSIQPNKNLHLITSLKSILKAHKINLCKQIFERSLSENRRTRSWNTKYWFWWFLVFWFAKMSKNETPTHSIEKMFVLNLQC